MQGAAPLASPRLNPGGTAPQCRFPPGIPALDRPRHLQNLPLWYPAGGLPPPPLALFLPPIPPPPFPGGEGGWGDGGQKRQLTAGQAGDKESPLPVGYPSGRSNKCRPGFSPRRGRTARRVPQRQRHAAPRRKTSPYHLTHNIKNDRIYAQIQANHKRKKGKYW